VDAGRQDLAAGATLPAVRPLLTPAVQRLWRDAETLQLGRAPSRAVVLAGVDETTRTVLAMLDGSRDRAGLLRAAAEAGCPPHRTARVIGLLADAGLVDDAAADRSAVFALPRTHRDRIAPDVASLRLVHGADTGQVLRRRRSARIVVEGAGRVGAPVAALLAAAGVGAVQVVDEGLTRPDDCGVGGLAVAAVGRPRQEAARELVAATAPAAAAEPTRVVLPDLVVLTPVAGAATPEPPRLLPHLLAEVRGEVGVVGPLVVPGTSACLRCLDLTRTDRDPGWPALAVQLATASRNQAPCDGVLAAAVAAQTALQALAFLDGDGLPSAAGGTLELALPDWRWRRRSWQLHPDCDCGWSATA
jgi:bacteriocin biosynthesis cyclodehydratase domain-containing protein